MDEQINLLDYTYPEGTAITIPGRLLEGMIQILTEVDKKETTTGFINNYPTSTKEVFRDEDFLEAVEVEWKGYTSAESYFNQKPQETKSLLGVMAVDLCLMLKQGHLENIKNGVAVKVGQETTPEDVKLSLK